jgi:chromosome segregation ATPase
MDEAAKIAAAVKAAEEKAKTDADKALAEKDLEINKLKEKDTNFEKVRKQLEDTEKKVKEADERAVLAEKARKEAEEKLPKPDDVSKRSFVLHWRRNSTRSRGPLRLRRISRRLSKMPTRSRGARSLKLRMLPV